jgi:serine protease Do
MILQFKIAQSALKIVRYNGTKIGKIAQKNSTMRKIGIIILAACVGGFVALGAYKLFEPNTTSSFDTKQSLPVSNVNLPNEGLENTTLDFRAVAAMATPAVVHIKTTYQNPVANNTPFIDPFHDFFGDGFEDFFGRRMPKGPVKGSGSGVIIAEDGYIITNNHVIKDADDIEVVMNNKKSYKGKVIGKDPNTDLALLKIEEKSLPFLKFGNSDEVMVGEWVLAVGNPFNLTSTVTAGIVSAKGRSINIIGNEDPGVKFPIESFIQTDAAVNPGNSGGALINTRGELVGINTAIASRTGSYAGYSFAVPVNLAKKVMDDLLEFGTVQRAFLNVTIRDINSEFANEKSLGSTSGVYVEDVLPDGAADAAGVKKGDVILSINSTAVNSVSELQEQIARYRPGDNIKVKVNRDGKEKDMNVVLKNVEKTFAAIRKTPSAMLDALGVEFQDLSPSDKKQLNLSNGVKVANVKTGGQMARNGIKSGFIITKIDNKLVKDKGDAELLLAEKEGDMISVEGLYPQNPNSRYIFSFGIK